MVCMIAAGCAATANPLMNKATSGSGGGSQAPATPALAITTSSLPAATAGAAYSAQLGASGGTAPYTWSVATGQLPAGVVLNAATGAVSGTPATAGTYGAVLKVSDSSQPAQSASGPFSIAVAAASGSGPDSGSGSGSGSGTGSGSGSDSGTGSGTGSTSGGSTPTGLYGSAVNSDALSNIRIGPYGLKASYRFMAEHTGTVSDMRVYLIAVTPKPGYEAGTGGKLLIQLQTDDGTPQHDPSGTTLASFEITNPQAGTPEQYSFPTIVFSPAPELQAGTLYHLVFSNVDANPSVNYVSVDNLWMAHPTSPMQPMSSDENLAVLQKYSGESWSVDKTVTPILDVDFSDGSSFGCGYMEVWSGVPEPIGGTNAVRETFKVSGGDKLVSEVSLRVARISGSGALTMKLTQSDGKIVESDSIPASELTLSASSTSATYQWVTFKFTALRSLFSGDGYNLEFDAPAGTVYQAFPVRKGTGQGFKTGAYFHDGYAEFNSGSGWAGWTQWGVTNRTDGDLQFYFGPGN